jgi:hypothetical protein
MTENEQKAKLIKDAIKLVDELGKCDVDDILDLVNYEEEMVDFVYRAKQLKRSRLWKLQ